MTVDNVTTTSECPECAGELTLDQVELGEILVCDDCGDVVEKEDDLNEAGLCSECLKKCCEECGDVQMDEDDLNEDGWCYSWFADFGKGSLCY